MSESHTFSHTYDDDVPYCTYAAEYRYTCGGLCEFETWWNVGIQRGYEALGRDDAERSLLQAVERYEYDTAKHGSAAQRSAAQQRIARAVAAGFSWCERLALAMS